MQLLQVLAFGPISRRNRGSEEGFRSMDILRMNWSAPTRIAICLTTALAISGCGPSVRTVQRAGDSPQPYMQFSVIVDRSTGSLGPAQAEADSRCAEVLQSALMYLAADVGEDQTRYYFRCR